MFFLYPAMFFSNSFVHNVFFAFIHPNFNTTSFLFFISFNHRLFTFHPCSFIFLFLYYSLLAPSIDSKHSIFITSSFLFLLLFFFISCFHSFFYLSLLLLLHCPAFILLSCSTPFNHDKLTRTYAVFAFPQNALHAIRMLPALQPIDKLTWKDARN
ncbi:unnamed protein product [Acanthosepion pharaonis]|uniref:Uncharacterized protein n=1 Tax=Acanthosepion pharaonis TaxID=158019 RepID=A0A812DW24_ACAPH|nr:unnamed protein product [Sepia pharaonis]